MTAQQQREQFESELRRQRLPPAYIQRLLEEWDDHLADLMDERSIDMAGTPDIVKLEDRLGNPVQLATAAAKQYHNRSFLGRHPIFTFLFLPLPLIVLGITAVVLSAFPFDYVIERLAGKPTLDHPFTLALAASVAYWLMIVIPPLGTVLLLCRIARRNGLNRRWAILGCGLVALYCSQLGVMHHLSTESPLHGFMCVTLGCFPISWQVLCFRFLPRFAFAFALGLLLVKRAQHLQKPTGNDQETSVFRQAA